MEIILIGNEKGGCCKTTTAILLANCLHAFGYRVLLTDFDPSGNLTCATLEDAPDRVLHDVLSGSLALPTAIYHTPFCDILPTAKEVAAPSSNVFDPIQDLNSKSLGQIANRLIGKAGAEYLLNNMLRKYPNFKLEDHYDFVILDSGPSDNILVRNAIVAADSVIIPVDPYIASLDGLVMFLNSIRSVQASYKTDVQIDGIVFSNYKVEWPNERQTVQDIEQTAKAYGLYTYPTRIRNSSNFPDSNRNCRPILDYLPGTGHAPVDSLNFTLQFLGKRGLRPKVAFPGVREGENGHLIYERPKKESKQAKQPAQA